MKFKFLPLFLAVFGCLVVLAILQQVFGWEFGPVMAYVISGVVLATGGMYFGFGLYNHFASGGKFSEINWSVWFMVTALTGLSVWLIIDLVKSLS